MNLTKPLSALPFSINLHEARISLNYIIGQTVEYLMHRIHHVYFVTCQICRWPEA